MKLPFINLKVTKITSPSFELTPPKDCIIPKTFPNCCKNHKRLHNELKSWINDFPNCCDYHKEMSKKRTLKKEDFQYVPQKILKQIMFTKTHIDLFIDSNNWYKEITHYIDLNKISFGNPNIGYDRYIEGVKQNIISRDEQIISPEKKEKLLKYITPDFSNTKEKCSVSDLNLLYLVFQKWLETFPDLQHFKKLKIKFKKKFPTSVMFYDHDYNRYTGFSTFKVRTKRELIQILNDATKQLLIGYNSTELIRKRVIDDVHSHRIDLENENHRLIQNKLLRGYSNKEMKYVQLLEKWLDNESRHINEICKKIEVLNKSKKVVAKSNVRKKEMTFLELFRNNQDRVDKFFKILNSERIGALDENNNWIYKSTKNSIVACFEALEDLEIIRKGLTKAKLQRTVKSEIDFEGNEKLFRNGFKNEDYEEFKSVFEAHLIKI
ncbi:MAG: hypothetical protein R3E32_26965 [Chitinophagales bacterium]